MYQTHSTTFSGWQHYYHQRQVNGPFYHKAVAFNEDGTPSNPDDAQKWIDLWEYARRKSKSKKKIFRVITAYDRCLPYKEHLLWEIVQNIPMKNLVGWTFVFEKDQIKIEYCTQISYVVEKLKPDEEDKRQYDLIVKLMEKGEKEETLKEKNQEELEDMLDKLTLKDETKQSEGKKEEPTEVESDYELDSDEEECRQQEELLDKLKCSLKTLNEQFYYGNAARRAQGKDVSSYKATLKIMKDQIKILKEIREYEQKEKGKERKIGRKDNTESLRKIRDDLKKENTDAIAAGKAFNEENYSQYFKDVQVYEEEGIVNYTKNDVEKLTKKLEPKATVIKKIQTFNKTFTYSIETSVNDLKAILKEKKEEKAAREKENKLKKEAVGEANKFNAENYGDYFTDVENYDLEKITKEDTQTIKDRMKLLGPKKTKIDKLRTYESVDNNKQYSKDADFDEIKKKAQDDDKEIRLNKTKQEKLVKQAEAFNKEREQKYKEYFTDIENYDLEKITDTEKEIKNRMTLLKQKMKKIDKLRTYDSVDNNKRYSEGADFDAIKTKAKKDDAQKKKDEIAAAKDPTRSREYVEELFDPKKDIGESYPIGLIGKVDIYTKRKNKKKIEPLLIVQKQKMVIIKVPSNNFDLIHMETIEKSQNIIDNYPIKYKERMFYDKKAIEVVQKGQEWYLQVVKPDNTVLATTELRGIVDPTVEPSQVGLPMKYKPRPAQNVTIRALNEDLLISHAPGKGKTFTAILKAEKKRNELKKRGEDKLPRILVLAPNAVLLKQWQKEVIRKAKLDPRYYVFQTYNLFRNTFTTGRYAKWKDLDQVSKEMITDKCWQKNEEGIWNWSGRKTDDHVLNYFRQPLLNQYGKVATEDEKNEILDTMFWPKLSDSDKRKITNRETLLNHVFKQTNVRKGKGKMPLYIQDTVTNKFLKASKLFRDRQKLRLPENEIDKWEESVLASLERRTDFYLLHQEDIFLHKVGDDNDDTRYFFFTNMKNSQRINKILDIEEDKIDEELDKWIAEQPESRRTSSKFEEEVALQRVEIENKYEERRQKRNAKAQENSARKGDQSTDTVEGLDAYGGKVPFTRRLYVGESETGLDPQDAYNGEKFISFLKSEISSRGNLRTKLPNAVKTAIRQTKLNEFDLFRDLAREITLHSEGGVNGRVQSKIIDRFTNPQHGLDLSQHRYQVDPSDTIVILDEAHDKEAITDNLNKVSTKVMFEFLKNSRLNLFVTATPMQSESPMVQLWLFSEGLKVKNGERLGIEDVKQDWRARKIKTDEKAAKDKELKLTKLDKAKLKRKRKYEQKFDVVYSLAKKISRSFEMQPTARRLFLDSVLSDIYFHETLPMVLSLDRRMYDDKTDRFKYFDKLTKETKNAILKRIGQSKFAVAEGDDFENPFPKKMRLLTPYDKGFMRSYMDEVRMNVCRYAELNGDKVYYDFTTRNKTKQYVGKQQYNSYAALGPFNGKDSNPQHRNFDRETSMKLFEKCKYKCIPIVINRCSYSEFNESERKEVDGRIMNLLFKEAFYFDEDKSEKFQPLIVPVLADNEDEAWGYLGRVLIKSYRQNVKKGKARSSRTLSKFQDNMDSTLSNRTEKMIFKRYIDKCEEKILEEYPPEGPMYDQIFKAQWMHYEPDDKNNTMPYIPNLMSSKYKDICELLMKKDREHVNGIVYHPNYQVHYRLGQSLMAHGAKLFDASDGKFLQQESTKQFIENAKIKILRKWDAYSGLYFWHHSGMIDNPEGKKRRWTPSYELERLKRWGTADANYVSRFYEDEENKSQATEDLHKLIQNLGEKLEEALIASNEWDLSEPIAVKKIRNKKLVEIKQQFWVKKGRKKNTIKYVKTMKKENENRMYLDKVYRLKEEVIRSDFGKYYALDDDDSDLILYEGRNGRDGNGPSGDYQGAIVNPASELDYLYYVTTVLPTKFTKVWSTDSNVDIRPSFGKATLQKKIDLMVSFSLESYDTTQTNHDERYEQQQEIRKLIRRAEKLVINDYYSSEDGENAMKKYVTLLNDVKDYEKKYFKKNKTEDDFNYKLNKILVDYVQLYIVVRPGNYKKLFPNRMFSQLNMSDLAQAYTELSGKTYICADSGKSATYTDLTSEKAFEGEISDQLDDLLNTLNTAKGKLKTWNEFGRPRYITKELMSFLQRNDIKEFLKVTDAVREQLKNAYPKTKLSDGKDKQAAKALLFLGEKDNLIQNDVSYDSQKERKDVLKHMTIVSDAIFSVDMKQLEKKFEQDPSLENLLKLKEHPFLKEFYASSRTWKFTAREKTRDKITKRRKWKNNKEMFEEIWDKLNVTMVTDQKQAIQEYYTNKFKKKMSVKALVAEATKLGVEWQGEPKWNKKRKEMVQKPLPADTLRQAILNKVEGIVVLYPTNPDAKEIAYSDFMKKDREGKRSIYTAAFGKEPKTLQITTTQVPLEIIPDGSYTWYKRKFNSDGSGGIDYTDVDEDNFKGVAIAQQPREGTMYQPYENGGVNLSKGGRGLRVETVPSSLRAYFGFEKMEKRHRALKSDTFISFMYYNAKDTGGIEDRDLVKQAHEAGLIDYLIMSGAGITGVDLQSTRQSLMVMVQPSKSPGLKDQFVGRLIRNLSHAIIPHKFQRVEHVTFFNSLRRAPDGISFSRQTQPWPTFNRFKDLEEEAAKQEYFAEGGKSEEATEEDNKFLAPEDEETKEKGKKEKEEEDSATESENNSSGSEWDGDETEEETAMDLDELLEDNMLYETKPVRKSKRKTKETYKIKISKEQEEEYKAEKARKEKEKEDRIALQNKIKKKLDKQFKIKGLSRNAILKFAKRVANNEFQPGSAGEKLWELLEKWGGQRDWTVDQLLQQAREKIDQELNEQDDDEMNNLVDSEDENDTNNDESTTDYKVRRSNRLKKRKEEVQKKQTVGGNLDRLVDSQIDNHVNVSAVITVGNHAFTTVQQYVNSDFKTVIGKEKSTEEGMGKFEVPIKVDFGFCCYNCHYENESEKEVCEVCGTELDDRYYRLVEYPILEQIENTELALPKVPLYPLSGNDHNRADRYMKPDGEKLRDAWTRQEAMMWHYKTGFFAKLVERNQLRYLLSMVTVEHFFKEQKEEVKQYNYSTEEAEGSVLVKTSEETPYGWENRLKRWYEVVYPNRNFDSTALNSREGQKESSDIEFEYLSEYESDIESEYSD